MLEISNINPDSANKIKMTTNFVLCPIMAEISMIRVQNASLQSVKLTVDNFHNLT